MLPSVPQASSPKWQVLWTASGPVQNQPRRPHSRSNIRCRTWTKSPCLQTAASITRWLMTANRSASLGKNRRRLSLQWRHNERDGVSNHQPHHCLLSRLFKRRSKETSKLRVNGLCDGNSPVTGEFPAPVNSPHKWPVTRENVSIWWRHYDGTTPMSCVWLSLSISSYPEPILLTWIDFNLSMDK